MGNHKIITRENSRTCPYLKENYYYSVWKTEITQDDINAVVETLQGDFNPRSKIKAFEDSFREYVDSKYAIAVSNGTAALHLGCLALGIEPGDRVITSPVTFAASANSILYCGGIVDFVDINENTYTIDLDLLEKKLAGKPKNYYKGIIPVAFGGFLLTQRN